MPTRHHLCLGYSAARRSAAIGPVVGACLLLLLGLLSISLPALAARHTVAGWGMEQGLPHNLVQSVAQGSDGFIWLGTWEGVVRFNGRSFTVFDRQNTPGAELSGVLSILPEANGGMLFGTVSNGIYRYRNGQWQALGGNDARNLSINALARDAAGSLWIGSKDRLLRMQANGQLLDEGRALGLPQVAVTTLRWAGDGSLLVGTEEGVYQLRDGRLQQWPAARALVVRDMVSDLAGGWILAADDGIHHFHADGRQQHLLVGERVDAVRRGVCSGCMAIRWRRSTFPARSVPRC